MPFGRSTRMMLVAGIVVGAAMIAAGISLARSNTPDCQPTPDHPEWSVARHWNEAALDAIRRDLPAPTVHARNLFHTSVAMWDAWAAYDRDARGYLADESHTASDVAGARNETISYAAYRVLEHRYIEAVGGSDSIPEFDSLMESLCFPIDITTSEGDSPAARGNRIAAAVIEYGLADGSNEANGYAAPDYHPVNEALVVAASGAEMVDPNRWQPLQIQNMVSQNGILLPDGVQEFIDPHWGHVAGFALPEAGGDGLPIVPGDPPYLGDPLTDEAFKESAVEIIAFSSLLDPLAGVMLDASPGSLGANSLGANDGTGHTVNPITGQPYERNLINQAEFGKAVAEFWADGPSSETPPGHWNTLANAVSDTLDPDLRIGGTGAAVDRLEWDVKLYLALNGANHDAAVAAWGSKGFYDYVRPISMIRYMGGRGQSTDPGGASYHPEGLPLVDGLIEVITEGTTAPGERHEHLAGHESEIAVRSWLGTPEDPEQETSGVAWILAEDWVPYQLPTFVTPSFAAYVSGHSTFSRASAEVLTALTGTEYFPGGLGEWIIAADTFEFEAGPAQDIVLQWATFADAADQAGLSRLWGGIHVRSDDLAGRRMGAEVGRAAWDLAQTYYGGF